MKIDTRFAQRMSGLAVGLASAAVLGVLAVGALDDDNETKPGRAEFQETHGERPEATPTPSVSQASKGIDENKLTQTAEGRESLALVDAFVSASGGDESAIAERIRWTTTKCRAQPAREGIFPVCSALAVAADTEIEVVDLSPGPFAHYATRGELATLLGVLLGSNPAEVVLLGRKADGFTMALGFAPRKLPKEFYLGDGAYGYLSVDVDAEGQIIRISPNNDALKSWRELNDNSSSGLVAVAERLVESEAEREAEIFPTPVKPK